MKSFEVRFGIFSKIECSSRLGKSISCSFSILKKRLFKKRLKKIYFLIFSAKSLEQTNLFDFRVEPAKQAHKGEKWNFFEIEIYRD